MAEKTCPQISALYQQQIFQEMHYGISQAEQFMVAENMWPYYDNLWHKFICKDLLRGMVNLVALTSVVAFFLFPILVLLVESALAAEKHQYGGADAHPGPDDHE